MALLARQIAPLTFATALISEVDPVAAGDLDGDGDDELIARLADDDDRGWVLGLGDARTPVLPGPGPVPAAQLPAAPLDPAIERAWRGALDLASMGLRGAAAEELEATARLAATPDARAQMLSRAGELWRGEGRAERAASAYEAALRQRDPANGAAVTRDTLGAARSWLDAHALEAAAAHLARIDGAAGAAGEEARATLAWLRPLLAEAASPIDVVDGGRLAPELKLRVPEAVARDRDGVGALRVDAFAGAGAVAVLPVRYAGGRVTIALELETEHAEIGAGLDVALRRPGEGEAALQLSFGVSGGGLVSDRVMGCGPWIDRAAPVWQQPTGPVDGLTHVTYELDFMPDPGGTRCVVRDVAGAVTRVDRHYRSRALPPGDYELVIRAGPPVPWDTVMWSRLTLRRLVVGGLTVRSVAPGPLERANRALYDGALTTADELHAAAGDVFGRLLVALRRHDGAAAAELVRALGEAAWTTAAGRGGRLLRVDPEATAPLVAGLGRGVLARAFARAWDVARRYVGDPLAQRGLLVPALDALTGRDGDELGLVASRMRLLLEGRDAARAYAIGERALSEADVAGGPAEEVAPLVAEIELLCAWGAHQLGDVVSARRHLERWLSAAPVREPALETLANQPEFAPLLGYLDP